MLHLVEYQFAAESSSQESEPCFPSWMILELVNASIHNLQTLHLYNKTCKNLPPTSCLFGGLIPYINGLK